MPRSAAGSAFLSIACPAVMAGVHPRDWQAQQRDLATLRQLVVAH